MGVEVAAVVEVAVAAARPGDRQRQLVDRVLVEAADASIRVSADLRRAAARCSGLWWMSVSMSSGRSISPKWICRAPVRMNTMHHCDGVVDVVPGQVAELDAGELARTSPSTSSSRMKCGMPGSSSIAGDRLEDLVGEDHPRHVELARPERRHLPVEDGDRLEVAVRSCCRSGGRPSRARCRRRCGRAGWPPARPAPARPAGERPMSGTAKSYHARARPGCAPGRRSSPGAARVEEGERRRGVGDRVQLGEHLDRGVLQRGAAARARRRSSQLSPKL